MNWPDAIYRIFHEGWGYVLVLGIVGIICWMFRGVL
jgi:hypothetical protein